jgi:hypothetical protein
MVPQPGEKKRFLQGKGSEYGEMDRRARALEYGYIPG